MVFSLRRLKELPPTTHVYPGHGPEAILGDESWLSDIVYPIL
jgi:glyoxylase-like metal-dependent hydrolase (beta-lactamase superfamily II)